MAEQQAAALLRELEDSTHHARTAKMIALGKDASAKPILLCLSRHGFFGRQLALLASYSTRDSALLRESLASSSKGVRELALRILLDVGADDEVAKVLSTLGACELKHALRKLHKAGNRKAVLHGLVEQAGVAADRKLLETCIVYGTGEQVARHWPLVEAVASDFTWGFLANYHPEYTAERLAQLPKETLPAKWLLVERFLLQHCPERVWGIVQGLARDNLDSLDLTLVVKKFPANAVALLLKDKPAPEPDEADQQATAKKAKKPTSASSAAAATPPSPFTPAAQSPAAPAAEAPPAPPIYDLVLRSAFVPVAEAKAVFGARGPKHLLERVHQLSDEQLLQAVVTRVLPVARVLRALPFARRLALYEAWKRQWGEQRERLRVLQQQPGAAQDASAAVQDGGTGALRTPSVKETLSKLAATVQESMFSLWADPSSGVRTSHPYSPPPPATAVPELLRWLPASSVTDHLTTMIKEAPGYWDKYSAKDKTQWLIALGPLSLPILTSWPNLLDVAHGAGLAEQLIGTLGWEQQVELLKQRWQKADEAETEAMAVTCATWQTVHEQLLSTATDSSAALAKSAWRRPDAPTTAVATANLMALNPAPTAAEVRLALREALEGLSVASRLALLKAVKGSSPMTAPYGLALNSPSPDKACTMWREHTRPPALAAQFEEWAAWWQRTQAAMESALGQVQQQPLESERRRAVRMAVAAALGHAAADAAFLPLTQGAPAVKVWHALPSVAPPGGSESPRLRLLRLMHAVNPRMLRKVVLETTAARAPPAVPGPEGEVGQQSGALDVESDGRYKVLLPAEAEAVAQMEPSLFLEHPHLLALLPCAAQLSLVERWAAARAVMERDLQALLAPTIAQGETPQSVQLQRHAQTLLLSSDTVAQGALAHLEPAARAVLFQACRHAWLAPWGSVSLSLLPEPHRTEVARLQLQALATETVDIKQQWTKAQSLLPWLPWREMNEHACLKEKLQGRGPVERQEGLLFLFSAAKLQPLHMPKVLEMAHQRKREQDSVRQALLAKLHELLEGRLAHEESAQGRREAKEAAAAAAGAAGAAGAAEPVTVKSQLPAILVLIEDALGAKDLSNTTLHSVLNVLMLLLPRHTEWTCAAVAKCVAVYGMQALNLSQLNTAVTSQTTKLTAACDARRAAAARAAPPAVPGAKPAAELQVPAKYDAATERFLLQLAAGLATVAEALKQRQDGALGTLQLLQQQWEWGRQAENRQALAFILPLKASGSSPAARAGAPLPPSPLREALLRQADAASELLAHTPPLSSWKEVQQFAELLLKYLPDRFLQFRKHVLPTDPADGIAFTSFAVNIVDEVPVSRLDLLMPFIDDNTTMPAVAAKAVKVLFAHHKDKLGQEVPRLLARDITFACLPQVLYYIHNVRQDLLKPLVVLLAMNEGMFKGGPPTAATGHHWYGKSAGKGGRSKRGGKGGRGGRGGRGGAAARGRATVAKGGKGGGGAGGGGWSRRACQINYWLGLPQLSSQWKWTPSQQQELGKTLVHVLYRGTISLKDVKNLVNRIAVLPAVPPSLLLSLLEDPAPTTPAAPAAGAVGGATAAASGGAGGVGAAPYAPLPETVHTLVKDSVMTALVRLDDSEQAWKALVESVRAGTSSTALAAVGALLTSSKGWATSGNITNVLERLRSLPWERTAVMREVVKVLGKLAGSEPAAFAELVSIAGRETLHRAVMQQLLTTMQAFIHAPEAQACFMRAATSKEAEVAKAAAFVPSAEAQKAPGVVAHTVALFELLLQHDDVRVKQEAMTVWAGAEDPIPLDRGMTVLSKMLTIGATADKRTRQQLMAHGQSCATRWFGNVMSRTNWADANAAASSLGLSPSLARSSEYDIVGAASGAPSDIED